MKLNILILDTLYLYSTNPIQSAKLVDKTSEVWIEWLVCYFASIDRKTNSEKFWGKKGWILFLEGKISTSFENRYSEQVPTKIPISTFFFVKSLISKALNGSNFCLHSTAKYELSNFYENILLGQFKKSWLYCQEIPSKEVPIFVSS